MLGEIGLSVIVVAVVAWFLNQGFALVWDGVQKLFPSAPDVSLSPLAKKAVAFAVAVGLSIYQDPLSLGDPAPDPEYALFLLGQATLLFKSAQVFYDQLYQRLQNA